MRLIFRLLALLIVLGGVTAVLVRGTSHPVLADHRPGATYSGSVTPSNGARAILVLSADGSQVEEFRVENLWIAVQGGGCTIEFRRTLPGTRSPITNHSFDLSDGLSFARVQGTFSGATATGTFRLMNRQGLTGCDPLFSTLYQWTATTTTAAAPTPTPTLTPTPTPTPTPAAIRIAVEIVDVDGLQVADAVTEGVSFRVTGPAGFDERTVTTDGEGVATIDGLPAGTYTVTELVPEGYEFVRATLDGDAIENGQQFDMRAGEQRQITFQNRKQMPPTLSTEETDPAAASEPEPEPEPQPEAEPDPALAPETHTLRGRWRYEGGRDDAGDVEAEVAADGSALLSLRLTRFSCAGTTGALRIEGPFPLTNGRGSIATEISSDLTEHVFSAQASGTISRPNANALAGTLRLERVGVAAIGNGMFRLGSCGGSYSITWQAGG